MGRVSTILGISKEKNSNCSFSKVNIGETSLPISNTTAIPLIENPPTKPRKFEIKEIDASLLEHDPELRKQIRD